MLSVPVNASSSTIFLSGSCDSTAQLCTLPEDLCGYLMDTRKMEVTWLQEWAPPPIVLSTTCNLLCIFSIMNKSIAYLNGDCYVWDTSSAEVPLSSDVYIVQGYVMLKAALMWN